MRLGQYVNKMAMAMQISRGSGESTSRGSSRSTLFSGMLCPNLAGRLGGGANSTVWVRGNRLGEPEGLGAASATVSNLCIFAAQDV